MYQISLNLTGIATIYSKTLAPMVHNWVIYSTVQTKFEQKCAPVFREFRTGAPHPHVHTCTHVREVHTDSRCTDDAVPEGSQTSPKMAASWTKIKCGQKPFCLQRCALECARVSNPLTTMINPCAAHIL